MNDTLMKYFIHDLADIAIFTPDQVDEFQYITVENLMSALKQMKIIL